GEIVAADQLHRIGVDAGDPRFGGGRLRLVAIAAADRRDFPALGAKTRHVHLRAESDADDADLARMSRHGRSSRGPAKDAILPEPLAYSGSVSPDPPISFGMSFIFGRPSFMRSTVS